jgi:hypothetical protein
MTLMTVGNSEGERRCDERCYDAKGTKCTCCCGGRNHGKGLQQALENSALINKEVLAKMGATVQGDLFAEAGV